MESHICRTHLLSDDPSSTDEFGSHDRVAKALSELVRDESGGRCIALMGSWGSGKSTTIRLLKGHLKEQARVFVFNAWTHQGDPLRRTFLEQLIDFLNEGGWLPSGQTWFEKKDELAKRRRVQDVESTPLLKPHVRIIGILLLLVPVGLGMFSRLGVLEVPKWLPWFGLALTLLPFGYVVAFLSPWMFLVSIRWFCRDAKLTVPNWVDIGLAKVTAPSDIFEILINRSTTRTKSLTLESGEPTSIEFQDCFNKLLQDCLVVDNRKLIIVIDNLDRVDSKTALSLWATINTFFDFDFSASKDYLRHLWLIVPFDPSALTKIWSNSGSSDGDEKNEAQNGGDNLAQVFMDKTFATSFHVPPPVLSDWHGYLLRQLTDALPDHAKANAQDFHTVYRVFRLKSLDSGRSPTPRDIKVFVNKVGSIHRQREDEIGLPLQALYVLLSNQYPTLEEMLRTGADHQLLGQIHLGLVGSEWRKYLAAIHYNAPVEKAFQLLLGAQVEAALISGNADRLEDLQGIHGVTEVIEEFVAENWQKWSGDDPSSVAFAADSLKQIPVEEDQSLNETWQMLCDAAAKVKFWTNLNSRSAAGIVCLLSHNRTEPFANLLVASLSKSSPSDDGKPDSPVHPQLLRPWLVGLSEIMSAIQAEFPAALKNFSVPGNASSYISIMSRLTSDVAQSVQSFFQPSISLKAAVDELEKIVAEERFDDDGAAAVEALLVVRQDWPWPPMVERLKERLNGTNTLSVSEIKAAIITLTRLAVSVSIAKKALTFLSQEGHLAHHLYQAKEANDAEAMTLCMLPIIENLPSGGPMPAVGNSSLGADIYTSFVAKPESNAELVNSLVSYFEKFKPIESVFALANSPETQLLAFAMINQIVSRPESWAQISAADIVKHFEQLKSACDDQLLSEFLRASAEKSSLVEEIISTGFDDKLAHLYLSVFGAVKTNEEFVDFLRQHLRLIEKDQWLAELSSESTLLELLIALVVERNTIDLPKSFEDAVLEHSTQLLKGEVKVQRLMSQWSELPRALDESSQVTLFQRMSDLLNSHDESTSSLLRLYGECLATESVLAYNEDRLVLQAFNKFLSRSEVTELKWLERLLATKSEFLASLKGPTIKDFKDRVKKAYEDHLEDESLSEVLQAIASNVGLTLKKPKAKVEEEPNAT
ncbi:MAG TPA: P-loop NTPase fold protein [Pyrinomonadaceae bacterium]|nr:P-loop NTPase fold protein [Pyrinomonadaceae bacterium]